MNAGQQNKSNKLFKIKVQYDNGFSLKEINANTFGQACYRIEKIDLKQFRTPIGFTLIEQSNFSR